CCCFVFRFVLIDSACFCLFFCRVYQRCVFFFFSSRRRHTRFSRDWSSDVCSSDLCFISSVKIPAGVTTEEIKQRRDFRGTTTFRSEERRVGKECRYRWASCHLKNKAFQTFFALLMLIRLYWHKRMEVVVLNLMVYL